MRKVVTLLFGFLPLACVVAANLGVDTSYIAAALFGLVTAGIAWTCPFWTRPND